MAVTKIWKIRGRAADVLRYVNNKEKTGSNVLETDAFTREEEQALVEVIAYAANENKTEQRFFTTAINCSIEYAKDQFNLTKKRFRKEGGNVAFHAYQSFEEGEVTPEVAHEIGVKLAKELWGERFQVVVATHLNTHCLHNHIVINSISFKDGLRFHDCRSTYRELREASDRICREYGLSVIEKPKGKGMSYNYYQMEQLGMPTRYSVARRALDEAIAKSCNIYELRGNLKNMGYQCQLAPNRKYWTITLPDWNRPIRTYRLGEEYTRERIEARVLGNNIGSRIIRYREMGKRHQQYSLKRRVDKIMGRSSLEKLYLRYCYELGYLPKYNQNTSKVHRVLKDALSKCEMYSREAQLLTKYRIGSLAELEEFAREHTESIRTLENTRDELRLRARRKIPEEDIQKCKAEISNISSQLKELRGELKLCEDIKKRTPQMEEQLREVEQDRERTVTR